MIEEPAPLYPEDYSDNLTLAAIDTPVLFAGASSASAAPASPLSKEVDSQPEIQDEKVAVALPGAKDALPRRDEELMPSLPETIGEGGERHWPGDDQLAVRDADLDEMRGGFETNTGLLISFGIERMVYVNGNLVTTTSFNIADVAKITAEEARMLGAATGTLALVQIGPGNTLQTGPMSQTAIGTVIQNTLNNQKIQSVTTINTTVNSFELLKSLNLQSVLKDVQINSIGGR